MAANPIVMNGWYIGAWSDEVTRTLMQRWICGRPVCFYRLSDGSVNAIEDRCPHRRYPLSLGRLEDDVITCNYHGYKIDGSGTCVGVAEQPDTPKASVHRFPVVERHGSLIMVDDERMRLEPGETPVEKMIRFRTLGCYPLSGAIESTASTLPEIIQEMLLTRHSERQGRLIDHDQAASMERKKREGYF